MSGASKGLTAGCDVTTGSLRVCFSSPLGKQVRPLALPSGSGALPTTESTNSARAGRVASSFTFFAEQAVRSGTHLQVRLCAGLGRALMDQSTGIPQTPKCAAQCLPGGVVSAALRAVGAGVGLASGVGLLPAQDASRAAHESLQRCPCALLCPPRLLRVVLHPPVLVNSETTRFGVCRPARWVGGADVTAAGRDTPPGDAAPGAYGIQGGAHGAQQERALSRGGPGGANMRPTRV